MENPLVESICPYCKGKIAESAAIHCPSCKQAYHAACLRKNENGVFCTVCTQRLPELPNPSAKAGQHDVRKPVKFIVGGVAVAAALAIILYAFIVGVSVKNITLNKSILTLWLKSSEALTCTVTPYNARHPEVTWASSDSSVATVNTFGEVTACSAGVCTVTATAANGKQATCQVQVSALTEQEHAAIGTWTLLDIVDNETSALSNYTDTLGWKLTLRDDLTAQLYIDDTTSVTFSWKYQKTDSDGDYLYTYSASKASGSMYYMTKYKEIWLILESASYHFG